MKIAPGHYKTTYKGFEIHIIQVDKKWYAELETANGHLAEQIDTKGDSKSGVLAVTKYKIDNYLAQKKVSVK